MAETKQPDRKPNKPIKYFILFLRRMLNFFYNSLLSSLAFC